MEVSPAIEGSYVICTPIPPPPLQPHVWPPDPLCSEDTMCLLLACPQRSLFLASFHKLSLCVEFSASHLMAHDRLYNSAQLYENTFLWLFPKCCALLGILVPRHLIFFLSQHPHPVTYVPSCVFSHDLPTSHLPGERKPQEDTGFINFCISQAPL